MVQNKGSLVRSQTKIAYPTLTLTLVASAAYGVASVAAVQGHLGVGWAMAINAVSAYLLFTPMHEAGHLNISGSRTSLRWIDEMVGWVSGIPLFAPFYVFKVLHFRHHAFTNDPDNDPDHWVASKNFLALLFHTSTIFPIYMIKGFRLLYHGKKVTKKVRKDLRLGFVGLFVLFGALVALGTTIGWGIVAQLWLIPALIAQVFLAITFDWLPHHPHEEKARFRNTRIFDIPGLNWLMLGQNYHLVHHLYPRVPFYDYQKAYADLKEEFVEEEVEIITLTKSEG